MSDKNVNRCPFCGSTDIKYGKNAFGRTRFVCMTCRAEGPPAQEGLKGSTPNETIKLRVNEALSLWNSRAKGSSK